MTIRVHFSLEALPGWLSDMDIYEYFVPLELTEADVRLAQREWVAENKLFPTRQP